MSDPLLSTKLYIPQAHPGLVPRPRLNQRLNEGLRRKLTLVCAPAGFGKTTLVSSWLHQQVEEQKGKESEENLTPAPSPPRPSAQIVWLSLDDADNDPARFLSYLIATLQQVEPTLGQNVQSLLASPQPVPMDRALTLLANDLAQITSPTVLVLDDYHHIRQETIHQGLAFLLDRQPPTMHIVIATRRDPPLALARLRVRGELIEIRERQLRFTDQEATTFFQQSGGLELDAGSVQRLRERTEGWVAGLQMAAISLVDNPDQETFVEAFTGSHRYVADYLMDEVLARQPEDVREFLLATSILNRLTSSLCDALLDEGRWTEDESFSSTIAADGLSPPSTIVRAPSSGQQILERLDAANLFIIPLDNERHWYRYHHLFRDFLRQRLGQQQPGLAPRLYGQASRWFEDNDSISEAIDMALAAEDYARVADLIEATAQTTIWQKGQWDTLLGWLEALPDDLVGARPRLCLYHAWGLMAAGNFDASEERLSDAEAVLEAGTPEADSILGQTAAVRSTTARFRGDFAKTVVYSRQALERLPETEAFWRASAALNLGAIYFIEDNIAAAQYALSEANTAAQAAENISYVVVATSHLSQLEVRKGRLRQAARLYQQALEMAQGHQPEGHLVFTTGMAHVGLGELYREWNELDTALSHLEQGLALGRGVNNLLILISGHIALARVKQAQGDMDAALAYVQRVEEYTNRPEVIWSWVHVPIDAYLVRLWLGQNQIDAAGQVAQTSHKADAGSLPGYWAEGQVLAMARLLVAREEYSDAMPQLEALAQSAERHGRTGSVIEIMVVQAVALRALDRIQEALAALDRALRLAEPGGYARVFVDEGPTMAELLRQLPASPYRNRLLDHFGPTSAPDVPAESGLSAQPLIEPLTDRELQILRLMAARFSNREIAGELYLATTTIKWYSRQIYGKLGVNDRRAAVERARELGIL